MRIPLTQGKFAIVNRKDFSRFKNFKWHALRSKNTFYAVRNTVKNGKRGMVLLHREILGAGDSKFRGHHKDGNGLNNLRQNILLATYSQNLRGFRVKTGQFSSQFRGVHWNKREKRWIAKISLGTFKSEREAARAYDYAAKQFFG